MLQPTTIALFWAVSPRVAAAHKARRLKSPCILTDKDGPKSSLAGKMVNSTDTMSFLMNRRFRYSMNIGKETGVPAVTIAYVSACIWIAPSMVTSMFL